MSLLETALAAAYRRLERPDLAAFVENGKLYQRLDFLLWGADPSFSKLCGLRGCMDGPQEYWPKNLYEWEKFMAEKYREHDSVIGLRAAEHP